MAGKVENLTHAAERQAMSVLIDGLLGSLTPQSPTKPSGPYFFDQIKIFLYGNTVIYVVYCSL